MFKRRGCGCGCGCWSLFLILLLLVALAATGSYWVHRRFGGGAPFPDILARSLPLVPESALEVVVSSPDPIGNVAVSATGRIFYTIHPESRPTGPKLYEWVNGEARPYPDLATQSRFSTPLGVVVDRQSRLWVVDHGFHGLRRPSVFAFDLESNTLLHSHRFESDVAPLGSFVQDLQVAPDGATVYLADASVARRQPAIIVYEPASGRARRLLEGHPSLAAQRWLIRAPGREMKLLGGLMTLQIGVDGIAIDPLQGAWLAWGAMTHDTLYRIPTEALRDVSLSAEALAARVERLGPKPINDGMSADLEGGILLTDPEHGGVVRWRPDGALETLLRAPRKIRWADALSFGPDGWLYVADSAIPDQLLRSKEHMRAQAPYFIYRFHPPVAGVAGQ